MGAIVFFSVVGLACIPGYLAHEKGHDFLRWWLFGVFAVIPAVVIVLIIEEVRPCPHCGAKAKMSATFCQSCGERLPRRSVPTEALAGQPVQGMTPMQREVLRQRAGQKTK